MVQKIFEPVWLFRLPLKKQRTVPATGTETPQELYTTGEVLLSNAFE